jgi:methionyl-tRNA formyltransferase
MEQKKLNIVIWCGTAPNQKALANKIAKEFHVSGIVIDEHKGPTGKNKRRSSLNKVIDHIRFRKIYGAWKGLMHHYDRQYPEFPGVPVLRSGNINDKDTQRFTEKLHPDLVAVSGTSLIKEPLVSIPLPIGILNLHTGLSPYIKGGPNCTNWCIANNQFNYTGNTIMWLNAGIDTGNIITTETVNILSARDLAEAHLRVMEQAHELYLKTLRYLENNPPPYASVAQNEIAKGKLYLTKMWTATYKKRLLENWKNRKQFTATDQPKTISLPHV